VSGPGRAGLRTLAELRMLLFWRRLRGRGRTAELVATAALFLLAVPLGLLFAGFLGAASYRAVRAGAGLTVDLAAAALFFGIWQAWTAVGLALSEGDALDLRRTLVYPVSPGRMYALGLLTGLAGDPFAAFWLLLLSGAFAGAAAGRFGLWLLPLGALFLAFAAATVALVALARELLSRMARGRWFREAAVLAGVAGWALLIWATRFPMKAWLPVARKVQWILFPPALAAAAGRHLYAGRVLPALPYLAALLAAAAACGFAAYRVALHTARSGGEEGRVRAGVGGGRLARLLSELLGPLAEKELHYLARHPAMRVSALVVPALAGLIAWKVLPQVPEEAGEVVRALPLFGIAAYVHLVLQVFWLNAFGWDRGGARVLFLAPLAPGAVLAAKNGAAALAAALLFLLAAAVYVTAGVTPPGWALAAALALHLGMAPWLFAAGNLVSIANPRSAPFALQRSGSLPALSALGGMAITTGATGLFGLPVLAALHWESEWLLLGAWVALGAAGWAAWRWSLPRAGRLLQQRREELLAEVTGDAT